MTTSFRIVIGIGLVAASCATAWAQSVEPFLGRWALTLPNGRAGWLGVTQEDGYLDASILWGGGSVVPVANVYLQGDTLYVTRTEAIKRRNADEKVVRTHTRTNTLTANVDGDTLQLTLHTPNANGIGVTERDFSGERIPDMPPAPDLSKTEFGPPVTLFNGQNLDGWRLINPNHTNGWVAEDGVLSNYPEQKDGEPHISYGNLRTEDTFEDFNLTMDVKVPENSNSGVYLRGIYEVQILDSYGEPPSPHHMGAIYSRITPEEAAEKPAGEWQTLDITLVDRHVTVVLNGVMTIDNEPLYGVTGGALTSNEFQPGPIYLQGDHGEVHYRNIILRPVVE